MPNPIKPTFKTEILPLVLLGAAIISSFYFYSHFGERVPVHWNMAGEVNGWGSRGMAAFLLPGIIAGMYLLLLVLPYADPKRKNYAKFRSVYHGFKAFLVIFMVAIYFVVSLSALGYNIPVAFCVPGLVGLLFIIIGSYMGKIKPNWFMGIRTPWTLSSDKVWDKTHQFGGKVFIFGGILMVAMNFIPLQFRMPLFVIMIVGILLGTVGYSYIAYLQEQKNTKHET